MIWVVGATGLVGSELVRQCRNRNIPVLTDRIDIRTMDAVSSFGRDKSIRTIINCAAVTNVDAAEEERRRAWETNCCGAENLACLAREKNALFIHLSTDYVFSGTYGVALHEEDQPNPCNYYGETKLAGERAIAQQRGRYYIVRTSWVYGMAKNGFIRSIVAKAAAGTAYAVNTQWGGATNAADLCDALLHIVKTPDAPYGIYHVCNPGAVTRYMLAEMGCGFAREAGLIDHYEPIIPVGDDYFSVRAPRPSWSYLSPHRFEKAFSHPIPSCQDSLKQFMYELCEAGKKL
ncbi:SDR family oxidoreductase [Chitinivibrio alkaliphilus]|uniref:dTDP-4-dehydrorhamnose reductase n=1 Tax=Chitinivibrio alkaliphilus ACht1 TaxID=1313304 RepID=U7DEE9_9BACT|nr:SDR family oxidoreductase [Chitinivibrio alkaliphilus]ERP39291.1 dTDP-4-keto-L-rhamnose reductase [Chitinivibrio alkaliphilus ACht1]